MMIEDLEEAIAEVMSAPSTVTGDTHPIVARDVLAAGSPKPFQGKPDQKHKDLDTQDLLYVPRFLVREWGWERFITSSYFRLWQVEAGEGGGLNKHDDPDPRPSERKKK